MSAEQYANLGSTTLTAAYTSGSGTLQVASTAGNFPASAPFRIVIIDQTTQAVTVILKVTAITDGTHFAVTAEGTDASANSGDSVKGAILTAAGLDAIRGDQNRVVTGALPSDGRTGDTLNPTDDIVRRIYSSGAFQSFGPQFPFTDPTLRSWAWRNQGGASVTTNAGSITIVGDAVSGVNLRCRETAAPGSTPWTVTACVIPQLLAINFHGCGIYVRDSVGGKMTSIQVGSNSNQPQIQCVNFDNETTFNAFAITSQVTHHYGFLWLQINDDGTNLKYRWSTNGINFTQFFSVARHNFLAAGPDKVGFFIDSENTTYGAAGTLVSLKFT